MKTLFLKLFRHRYYFAACVAEYKIRHFFRMFHFECAYRLRVLRFELRHRFNMLLFDGRFFLRMAHLKIHRYRRVIPLHVYLFFHKERYLPFFGRKLSPR